MGPLRITLEDLLACWRAAVAFGGDEDAGRAAEIAPAIAREAQFTRAEPETLSQGDRSLASAAKRFRVRGAHHAPSFSNAHDLRALAAVASAPASILQRQNNIGEIIKGPHT